MWRRERTERELSESEHRAFRLTVCLVCKQDNAIARGHRREEAKNSHRVEETMCRRRHGGRFDRFKTTPEGNETESAAATVNRRKGKKKEKKREKQFGGNGENKQEGEEVWEASSSPEPGGGPEEGEEAGGERSRERPGSKGPRASAGPGRGEAVWVSQRVSVCVCVFVCVGEQARAR